MALLCVVAVLCLFLQPASLQSSSVLVRESSEQESVSKSHDFSVKCPNNCTDKLFFELDCSTGDLMASRPPHTYIGMLEEKVNSLEDLLIRSGLLEADLAQGAQDVTSHVLSLEDKLDRVVQCLSGY